MEAVMKKMKMGMGRMGVRFLEEEEREWRLLSLLYADDMVLWGKPEEDMRTMVGRFVEMCRRGLKVNAGKSKVMVMNWEEGLECDVYVDGVRLEYASEFIYLGCVLDGAGTNGA